MTRSKAPGHWTHAAAGLVLVTSMLAGCAGSSGLLGPTKATPPFRDPAMSMESAKEVVVVGQTTKAEVAASLGDATMVKFDSGYEVWVYRAGAGELPGSKAEFVILFSPLGVVKKTRLRPAYAVRPT